MVAMERMVHKVLKVDPVYLVTEVNKVQKVHLVQQEIQVKVEATRSVSKVNLEYPVMTVEVEILVHLDIAVMQV